MVSQSQSSAIRHGLVASRVQPSMRLPAATMACPELQVFPLSGWKALHSVTTRFQA
jgi:hypothetical protein